MTPELFHRLKIACYILAVLFTHNVFSADLDKRVSYFNKQCEKAFEGEGGNNARPNRLILIDATDPLSEAQKQFLRDNFIKNFTWQDEGEKVSIVLLNNTKINNLDVVTLCTPLPEDKITFTMATKKEKKKIHLFEKTFQESFERLVSSSVKADQTLLIESLIELYRNKRYDFLDGNRKLILASDLFQNSSWISFFNVCKNDSCPTYEKTLKDKNFSEFINSEVKIRHLDQDQVEIYHLKLNDKVVLSAKNWWKSFLEYAGFNVKTLKVNTEL